MDLLETADIELLMRGLVGAYGAYGHFGHGVEFFPDIEPEQAALLVDAPRSGRPSVWSEAIEAVLSTALAEPPERWGYRAAGWTAGLVQQHIARWTGQQISASAIRQHLHDSGYAWKRFRYVLEPDPQREKKAGDSAPGQSARAPCACGTPSISQYSR